METTMKQIRRLFLLLCLITAGAQCTWAYYSNYKLDKTVTINNLKYDLFSYYAYEVNGYVHTCVESRHYACLVDILGTNEDVVIPGKIEDNGVEYTVNTIGTLIENNSIKSLTFQGPAVFYFSTFSWKTGIDASGNNTYGYQEYSGFIKSTSLQTIEFQGGISEWNFKGARLLCPNLRHVVFTGNAPTFSGTWSNYCTAPASNVTAVVTNWSQETCEQKQLTATVWCEFKNVVPSLDLVHDATLKSNGGGDVQIWKNKNNKSQLDYTMSSEGGEELVTFYGNVDSYQIRVYTSSNYNNPVLKRNGTVVNLETGSGYYYYDETSHMSVTSYEVVYNANNSRRLNFLNFGNGTVTLSGVSNGSAVSYETEGLTETTYTFDKTTPVSVTITPQEGYKVQRIEHYGRIALPFDVNETTGVATTQYIFDDNESEQALKIYYQKKVIDVGTQFKLRISVDGSVGIGSVFYTDDGNYDWYDDDIDDNYFGYEIAPGESEEVIGKYELGDIMVFDFYVVNHLDEEEVAAGFTTMVNVYANGGKVECSDPGTEWGDYYSIPLDGGDMDVRVVIESNGRYLTGDNGSGGRVAIYCEGSETPLRIEDPGYWFWTLIPKTANPYVVITPLTGKTVVAVVRDGKMLSSLSTYRQSDGTYRIPLEGFDKGDSDYPLYVVYGDDISEVPVVEWNLLMVGDVDEANNENPKANVLWMVDGSDFLSVSEGASLNASGNIDKTYNLPTNTSLDFYIYVKPGQTFKVSFNGTDVTNIFVRKADYDNDDGTLCYVYEASGYEQFATSGTWVVEFKKATDIIEFADEAVKAICVANWDTNGDGELSKAEAAAVTTLRVMNEDMTVYASPFKNNAEIISFDELQYFTGLTEIADSAFYRCQTLQSVVVPNTLKIIKAYSFYYSPALTSVRLPEGLQKIGDFAFAVCTTLSNIHIPSTVTSLGTQAFSQCYALKQVIIPENVSKATHVFSNCRGLLSIFIPKNVTDIGSLSGCSSLTSIAVEPGNTVYDSRNGCNALIRTADNTLLHGCATTQIPEDIKTISGFAFSESRIETIDIPNGVETISGYAFQNCSMLTSVTIPESVTSIGNYTFSGCSRLKTVVSKIKEPFAFGTNCFSPALRKLIVPAGTRDAYIAAGWTENIFRDGIEEAPEDNSRYDLNGDDEVDIADVTKLVNMVLGNDQPSSNP